MPPFQPNSSLSSQFLSAEYFRPIRDGGKRTVFLCNTNALAIQQTTVLRNSLSYEVGVFTGDQNVDNWSCQEWQEKLENYQILVATTQVILDAVNLNFISIKNFNVLVFDECHHGRKDHPMHELMKKFDNVKNAEQPRIIGLSGMLIGFSNNPNQVQEELQALESTFLSKIVTVSSLEDHKKVLMFSTNPVEAIMPYQKEDRFEIIQNYEDHINAIIEKITEMDIPNTNHLNPRNLRLTLPKPLKDLKNLFENFRHELLEMGLYGAFLCLLSLTIEFELIKKETDSPILQSILAYCITEVEWMKKDLSDVIDLDNPKLSKDQKALTILKYSTSKVRILINYLKIKFFEDTELQCIVFVERRYTAKVLYHLFKEYGKYDKEFRITPDFMVGFTGELPESIEAILKRNFNRVALDKFKLGKTNCMISSSVLEEGIDIQSCNLVVMYDKPKTYRAYVQTKGRARFKTSNYVVLLERGDVDKFKSKKMTYDEIDNRLKQVNCH
jgi:endoribonuclease Dicer